MLQNVILNKQKNDNFHRNIKQHNCFNTDNNTRFLSIRMISACDTEIWSNDCWQFSFFRIKIRESFIAKFVYTHKEFVLVLETSSCKEWSEASGSTCSNI